MVRSALVCSELCESVFEGTEIRLNVPSTNDKGVCLCVSSTCATFTCNICVVLCALAPVSSC